MISGPLLGLYLLGMLFRTPNSVVGFHWYISQKATKSYRAIKVTLMIIFQNGHNNFSGRTAGNDCGSSVDSVGWDWRPALPSDS